MQHMHSLWYYQYIIIKTHLAFSTYTFTGLVYSVVFEIPNMLISLSVPLNILAFTSS